MVVSLFLLSLHRTNKPTAMYITIGSIIIFNGKKCIVTHTYSYERQYAQVGKAYTDITMGTSGFLKNIDTGEEVRSVWGRTPKENLIHFEDFGVDRLKSYKKSLHISK